MYAIANTFENCVLQVTNDAGERRTLYIAGWIIKCNRMIPIPLGTVHPGETARIFNGVAGEYISDSLEVETGVELG